MTKVDKVNRMSKPAKIPEWVDMYCVESHRQLTRGVKYSVKINDLYNAEVRIRGKIIYTDPRYFQLNPPIIREEVEEEEEEFYDTY